MSASSRETLVEDLLFPEAPRWWGGKLWFVDMHARRVHCLSTTGELSVVATLDDMPSGMGFLPSGHLIVVSRFEQRLLRWDGRDLTEYADLSKLGGHTLNDMVIDGEGRAFVGVMGKRGFSQSDLFARDNPDVAGEQLAFVPLGGEGARIVADGLIRPNGCVVTPDQRTLIVAESRAQRLTAFDIDGAGNLSNRRVFADLGERLVDGIALDREGAIWIGTGPQMEFLRVVEGGEVTDVIALDDRWAIACTLGGHERRTLYMLTADTTLEGLARVHSTGESDSRGWVEVSAVRVAGAGWP